VMPDYVIVRERDSAWRGAATVGALGAAGVLLYFLVKNLGLGGRGKDDRSKLASPAPGVLPPPGDARRLTFVMTQPTPAAPSLPMSFRGPDAKDYSLDEMIARVRAGGRSDVVLKISGNVRAGSAESAKDLVKKAGIEIWIEGGTRVSGAANGRGQYGGSRWSCS